MCMYIYIQRLDEELAVATEAFFEGESCTLDLARREVTIQHYVLIIVIFHMKNMCIAHWPNRSFRKNIERSPPTNPLHTNITYIRVGH